MVNTEEVIKNLGFVIAGLERIKSALGGTKQEEAKTEKVEISGEILANKVASTYTTLHPEYRIESQFRNLQDMANNPNKVSILFNWLRKSPDGIEEFFKLPQEKKQEILKTVISTHESVIKEVLTKRFSL